MLHSCRWLLSGGLEVLLNVVKVQGTDRMDVKLRGRVSVLISVLINCATYVSSNIVNGDRLFTLLVSFTFDKSIVVRRFGFAGLGELLFYISTSNNALKISGSALTQFIKSLREETDEFIQNATLQTYRNVLCTAVVQDSRSKQSPAMRFATREVSLLLLQHSIKGRTDGKLCLGFCSLFF